MIQFDKAWSTLLAGVAILSSPSQGIAQKSARLGLKQAAPLTDSEVRSRADALIAQMTPAEKAGQLVTLFALLQVAKGTQAQVSAGKAVDRRRKWDPGKFSLSP